MQYYWVKKHVEQRKFNRANYHGFKYFNLKF